ncbi:TldD/PmbA family protein [bacterium 3DAC]|nr:TldD/PmbA family protein [Dictyoglomota bacterium]UZN23737.1 TldD/PmbA family protein [bacterium 3DAC]
MFDVLRRAVDLAMSLGATFADARAKNIKTEHISVENDRVDVSTDESLGWNIRVIVDGAWGFAATHDFSKIDEAVRRAVALAKYASSAMKYRVKLVPAPVVKGEWISSYEKDPFEVSLPEKIDLLKEAVSRMKGDALVRRYGSLSFRLEETWLVSSEGAQIYQKFIESGGGISAMAVNPQTGDVQTRSYPNSFGGQYMKKGWELIEELRLPAHAEDIAKEAMELLNAPELPEGRADIIIEPFQMALQIHETCGHPTELDRVLGEEASFAGTSFLTPDKLGTFRYGSPVVTIVADPTVPHALGGFGYDDEGVPAHRTYLVREGIFVGYLSSRETAAMLGLSSSGGAMRAEGWWNIPIVRMTSVNLLPGSGTLDELLSKLGDGYLLSTTRNWSIADDRSNFHFGVEVAYEVKNGKLTGNIFKKASYGGKTVEFWNSAEAFTGEEDYVVVGVPNCGKGEPMQTMRVSHGAPYGLFRGVKVGG